MVATIVGDVENYVTVVLVWMDQCDSLITKSITVLLDWDSGDINTGSSWYSF